MRLTVVIVLLLFITHNSHSCDCVSGPIATQFDGSDYVVTAEVVELLDSPSEREEFHWPQKDQSSYRVKIRVTRSFKDSLKAGEIIELDSDFTNCDPLFELGEVYLLFLHSQDGKFREIPCFSWDKASEAKADIKKIATLSRRQKSGR
ncbi:MAG: hypothetical protein ACMVP2_19725 [Imperialibacter sp.]|uniref:hypothetical protein n=1 Tax=Imperialibacter sp. TaxID=2038411 RepID=UPI003A84D5CA